LTEEERVKEDMEYLAKKAKEEQASKGPKAIEKYHHKGAFFMVSVLCLPSQYTLAKKQDKAHSWD